MINALSEAPEGVHHRPCAQFLQKEAFLNPTSVILHRRDIFSARQPTMLASLINPGSIPRRSETLNLHFLHPSPFLKRSRTGSICMSSASFKRFEPKTLEKLADGTLGDYPAEDLLWGIGNAPFDLLMAAAGVARDRRSDANVMTFSPKVFIPLTRACRNSCGYCTFCSAAETGSENVPELGRSAGNCAQWSKSRLQRGAFYVGRQARASLSGTHGGVISHVGIIMGSDSDLPVMKDAAEVLDSFQVPYEIAIVSAHRTPKRLVEYAEQAHERGIKVIIAGAGGAAHLPGMVASMTLLPVIGVPLIASSLDGMDSLLSIVQMPKGVPVATVAIQNATNAALLAIRILGSTDSNLQEKLCQYQIDMNETVLKKTEKLETVGWKAYLS